MDRQAAEESAKGVARVHSRGHGERLVRRKWQFGISSDEHVKENHVALGRPSNGQAGPCTTAVSPKQLDICMSLRVVDRRPQNELIVRAERALLLPGSNTIDDAPSLTIPRKRSRTNPPGSKLNYSTKRGSQLPHHKREALESDQINCTVAITNLE